MSLTQVDIDEIRSVVNDVVNAVEKQNSEIIKPLQDEISALRNDIKEIYDELTT